MPIFTVQNAMKAIDFGKKVNQAYKGAPPQNLTPVNKPAKKVAAKKIPAKPKPPVKKAAAKPITPPPPIKPSTVSPSTSYNVFGMEIPKSTVLIGGGVLTVVGVSALAYHLAKR